MGLIFRQKSSNINNLSYTAIVSLKKFQENVQILLVFIQYMYTVHTYVHIAYL
jgi:hypothetical protein